MPSQFRNALALYLLLLPTSGISQLGDQLDGPEIIFAPSNYQFSEAEEASIEHIIKESANAVRTLLPSLPSYIRVSVSTLNRDVTEVGGVVGSADTPTSISIRISTLFEGGIIAASQTGLAAALYHEFHHLARGWTMEGNRFGPGIRIAAVNEGLATVFS